VHDKTVVVKYCSAIVILIAMVFHTLGITPWNSYLQILGILGWTYVGIVWDERAILLNFLPQLLIIIPGLIYLHVA